MAIYHLSAKPPIARAAGRSVTAAAAYRAGVRIVDERTALVYDYTRKRGVISSRLVTPGGHALPDRQSFWNDVERHHKRSDAVLAREVVVALPAELGRDERESLAWAFAAEIADRYEVAVDCCLHEPSHAGDQRNWHAHLLLSACTADAAGVLGKKATNLDPIYCRRNGIPDSVAWLRPRWEALCNEALRRVGSDQRIDHRSNLSRGLPRLPSIHVGRGASARRRKKINIQRQAVETAMRLNSIAISGLLDQRRVADHDRLMRLRGSKRRGALGRG
jgi:hypothetical protein